jgi:TRAP-type C4-dicarboxylate transport system permease small subunit
VAGLPEKLDHAVYRLERLVVVASLVVMSVVVFLDVIHRTFASEENKFVSVLAKTLGLVGLGSGEVVPGTPAYASLETAAPIVLTVLFVWLAYFGIRTANREVEVPPVKALIFAVVGVIAAYGIVRLIIIVMPNGFIWSQPLALVLTLWVGFFGASMCTHDNKHLKVEAVQRILPERVRPMIGFISGLVTTAFTFALTWLSLRYVLFHYGEYVDTEGQGGLVKGLDAPTYLCFAALPIAFAFMTVRFAARAFRALRGEVESVDPLKDLIEDGHLAPPAAPSEIPTEVSGIPVGRRKVDPLESEVPTEVVPVSQDDDDGPPRHLVERRDSDAPVLPSEIPTDPHRVISGQVESHEEEKG